MATVRHMTIWAGRAKYQADGVLLNRVYKTTKSQVSGENNTQSLWNSFVKKRHSFSCSMYSSLIKTWAALNQFATTHSVPLRFVAVLFPHLCSRPRCSFLPWDFLNNIWNAFTIYSCALHVRLIWSCGSRLPLFHHPNHIKWRYQLCSSSLYILLHCSTIFSPFHSLFFPGICCRKLPLGTIWTTRETLMNETNRCTANLQFLSMAQ